MVMLKQWSMRCVLDVWRCQQKEIRLSTVLVLVGHSHKTGYILPWGTPDITGRQNEYAFMNTPWCLSERYSFIQSHQFQYFPSRSSLWETLLKHYCSSFSLFGTVNIRRLWHMLYLHRIHILSLINYTRYKASQKFVSLLSSPSLSPVLIRNWRQRRLRSKTTVVHVPSE